MTPTMLTALPRNNQPVPTQVMTYPAIAGPAIRAMLNTDEFNGTALDNCSGPTISCTNACLVGTSNARTTPSTRQSRYACQSCTAPPTSSSPNTAACPAMATWM